MMKRKFNFPTLLILFFCCVLIVVGGLFTFLYSRVEIANKFNSINETHYSMVRLFSETIKKDVKFGQSSEIYRKCQNLIENKYALGVFIYDKEGTSICSLGDKISEQEYKEKIYFDPEKTQIAANVIIYFSPIDKEKLESEIFNSMIEVFIVVFILSFVFIYFFIRKTSKGLKEFSKNLKNLNFEKIKNSKLKETNIKEVHDLYNSIIDMHDQLETLKNKQLEYEKEEALVGISKQIAHDIRSPLEALRSVTGHMDDLDFQHRKIITSSIQRISDIAGGLLREGKETSRLSFVNLNIVFDELFLDKIFEYGTRIKFENRLNYRGSFINGDENTLYRIFSNLINNAFEAYNAKTGDVMLSLEKSGTNVVAKIQDFGKGMSSELIEKVIEGGFSTKDKGNGLGISSAHSAVKKYNGSFKIDSLEGEGTTIIIEFKRLEAPPWFIEDIIIKDQYKKIICVDDDPGFLEVYQEKLKAFDERLSCILPKYLKNISFEEKSQYFFDYDLGRNEKTGLDLILENGLEADSILVTSMYQDENIQKICLEHGIKILPKQIFNSVKVSIEKEITETIVFIDNDEIMHLGWSLEAKKHNITLKTYFNVADFLNESSSFSRDTKIFIDSDLGDGLKGEVESKKIFDLGFTEIFLATGFRAQDINKPDWIKEVVGKRPSFS